jgi:hypothetical protein
MLESSRSAGVPAEELSFEDIGRIVEERRVRFSKGKNWHIAQMFRNADTIYPLLANRTWSVLVSESGSFICSDHPVTIVFTKEAPRRMSPGFALNNTEVTVPLSKHVLLRGVWTNQPDTAVVLNRKLVARYNTVRIMQTDRFLFSRVPDFPWMDHSNRAINTGVQL